LEVASEAGKGVSAETSSPIAEERPSLAQRQADAPAEATGEPALPVIFRRPDGTLMPTEAPCLPASDAMVLIGDNRRLGLDIGPATGHPFWAGEHLDLGLALEALFSRRAARPAASPA
jgi:hypothetical protein